MKDLELRLVAELMKNSRRSDRQLARALGVSQPTVSRLVRKLRKEGVIREFTMIPDFAKLGYGLMSVLLISTTKVVEPEEVKRVREAITADLSKNVFPDLMNERGLSGLGFNGILITLHRSYSDYISQMNYAKSRPFVQPDRVESFLVDLKDPVHYRSLTLSLVANDLTKTKEEANKQK